MGLMLSLLLMMAGAPTASAAPDWNADELKGLLARAQAAARTPTIDAQNRALLTLAVAAYRAPAADVQGDVESTAKRVLRRRLPDHPNVKKGQWLNALLRQFYADASARCGVLGRFARGRADRAYFERMKRETLVAADQLAASLQLEVDGLDGFSALLPVVDGAPPYRFASQAVVGAQGGIDVDGMERIRFVGHRPPPDAERTARGSVRKLFSAFQFFERSARSLASYDRTWAKKRGHVRAVVPARFPAVYLNEIARAARGAKMRRMHVMVMTKRGELRELRVDLSPRKKRRKAKGKKGPASIKVTCADDIAMTLCAQRIAYAAEKGRPYWATP